MTTTFAHDLDKLLAVHRYRGVPRRTRTMIKAALDADDTDTLIELLPHVVTIMLNSDTAVHRPSPSVRRPSRGGGR